MPKPKAKSAHKSRQPKPVNQNSSVATLAMSSLHITLEALETEHQRLITQIKRKRTELNNFVEQLRSLATQIFSKTDAVVKKMIALDQEIHQLFDEILADKKLGKKSRHKIETIYENLQMMGIIRPQNSPDDYDEENEELDELFEETETDSDAPPEQKSEQPKHIRQTFLRLAEIFHPDKVADAESQQRHTEIMQEINRAYHENDLARLLEIEKQHLSGGDIESENQDDLTRRCQLLEQQNQVLKSQYENLKRELTMFKRTPEGSMVSDYRKAIKEDIDPIAMMVKEAQREAKMIEGVRDFVRDFKNKKITLQHFLKGPDCLGGTREEMLEDLFEEMFGVSVQVSRF